MFGRNGDPLKYPGQLPSKPVLLHDTGVTELEWRDNQLTIARTGLGVNTLLESFNAPVIEQRFSQIAYGANRDLHNLAWKLRSYAQNYGVSQTAIVVPAKLRDADIVACNIGYWGYVYGSALLHRPPALNRPYLAGSEVDVALLMLDEDQIHAMHRSEGVLRDQVKERGGVSCDVAIVCCEVTGPEIQLRAQLYVLPLPFISFDESSPAPFAAVARRGGDQTLRYNQIDLWSRIGDRIGLEDPLSVAWAMQRGAVGRAAGDPGTSASIQPLYERIRSSIIESMPLVDFDGTVRTGTDGIPGLLSLNEAWINIPKVGQVIRG
jgi:hypothetical protein